MPVLIEEDDLVHYGILRRSGRYPWGSGDISEYQRNKIFLDYVNDMRREGISEKDIATGFDISIKELRNDKSVARNQNRAADIAMAQRLKDRGWGPTAIGERMQMPESNVRALLEPGAKDKNDILFATSNRLKKEVADKTYVDVGSGVEHYLGITASKLDTAVGLLRSEGYEVWPVPIPQLGAPHDTRGKILCPPGTTQRDVFLNKDKIQQVTSFSDDGGRNFYGLYPPLSLNPKRVHVRYGDEGGAEADGMIYVRPGIKDIELGAAQYSQVRIVVGKGHYLKGMAMYKDDLPDGVDIQFNTSKRDTGDKLDAMKPIKSTDANNPFGSRIDHQIGKDLWTDKGKLTSVMNIVNEQGDWEKWSRSLSSQMLSKQSPTLAKQQLDMTFEHRQQQYEDIMALTNMTVRKKMLKEFAESTASASVHLKAASLPGQAVHVILPLSNIKPTHVYAPRYENGERVVLIRHPHGGTFEIPDLIVNNRNAEGRKLIGKDSSDAIGIHHSVAKRLSGADFDGDTVLVIPDSRGRITITSALKELKDFDPIAAYPKVEGMKTMSKANTQAEMGKISNLITDMTIHGAPPSEIARAIKHSMVVIDAEKHELNYTLSANDNNIKDLQKKYQRDMSTDGSGGASTLISRARAKVFVPERKARLRKEGGPVDPVTGELRWTPTNRKNKEGQPKLTKTTRLAEARDAHTLSSGTRMETLYANHSNKLKALSNQARLDELNTPPAKSSASAKQTYAKEVASLNSQLALANRNKPLERQAQLFGGAAYKAAVDANPDMDKDTKKKIKYQMLEEARRRTGAHKTKIKITPEEWDAIQAGAISHSKLTEILNNADMDIVHEHASPPRELLMTSARQARATSMAELGYTRADIAKALGVSLTTLDEGMK